jgi:hypothetical protein
VMHANTSSASRGVNVLRFKRADSITTPSIDLPYHGALLVQAA